MNYVKPLFSDLLHDESGQDLIEYARVDRVGRHGEHEDARYHDWDGPHQHWNPIDRRYLASAANLGLGLMGLARRQSEAELLN